MRAMYGVASSPTKTIAVGEAGAIASKEGRRWTMSNLESPTDLHQIRWDPNASEFVAVGAGGRLIRSLDGEDWHRESVGLPWHLTDFASSETTAIVTAREGRIAVSSDGKTWTPSPFIAAKGIEGAIYSEGRFLVVGGGGLIASSLDGVDWRLIESGTDQDLFDVVAGPPVFVAVGAGGTKLYSEDGYTWSAAPVHSWYHATDGLWTGSQLLVVGAGSRIFTSPAGAEWTRWRIDTVREVRFNGVAHSGNIGVAVGADRFRGVIWSAIDGEEWRSVTPLGTKALWDVAWTGEQFVVVGAGGTILRSDDGTSWIRDKLPSGGNLRCVAASPHAIVVGEYRAPTILHYRDQAWQSADLTGLNAAAGFPVIEWTGDNFLAPIATGAVLSSPDGGEWELAHVVKGGVLAIVRGENRFLVVGGEARHEGAVLLTSDFETFEASMVGPRLGIRNGAWTPLGFMLFAQGGRVFTQW